MRRILTVTALITLTLVMLWSPAMAEKKPIQLALFTPIQIVPETYAISGIRLSLFYGKNTSVSGFDWGLVTHTTSGMSEGVRLNFVGLSNGDFTGFQWGFVNYVQGSFEGFQWGFVNYSKNANGFQLGLVNYAGRLKGLQIGLVNIIDQGGQFPVFPIVIWSF